MIKFILGMIAIYVWLWCVTEFQENRKSKKRL